MNFNYLKTAVLFLLILGGCGRVSDRDLAQLSSPVILESACEEALAREFFEQGGWPNERWWEMFEDPQLNEVMQIALRESPILSKALAKVAEVENLAKKERAALLPQLDMEYLEQWNYFSKNGFNRSFFPMPANSAPIPATDNQIDLTLNFSYELDFFGKYRNLYKASIGLARATRAESLQATLILTTLIVQTYIELQMKLIQKEILQDKLEEREQLFELSVARNESGIDATIPPLQREQGIYETEQALLDLEKEIAIDRHALSSLCGFGPDVNLAPKPMRAIFERPFPLPTHLSSDLLARRPDLTAQLWHIEAAAAAIDAAKAEFYPSVNLMAFAGLESLSFNKLFSWDSRQGNLTPAIHLPIFTGGRLTANLKSKVDLFNQEIYAYNELLLNAAQDVADQISTLIAAFDRLSCQINTMEVVEEDFELHFSRYYNGIDNFLSVLESEDQLQDQRLQLFSMERDYLLAVLKLIKALGGGYRLNLPANKALEP